MKLQVYLAALALFLLTQVACKPSFPDEPVLEFVSVSKTFMQQNAQDSLIFTFSFTDGDGNLGSDVEDNIFLMDSRTGDTIATYRIYDLAEGDPETYRKGTVTLVAYSRCCIYPDSSACYPNTDFPTDEMRYQVKVKDETGLVSNIIESDIIQLQCTD